MKKYKVVLVEHSEVLENGSRKLLSEKVLCTCDEKGTAELIKVLLGPPYEVLTGTDKPNEHLYHLAIKY